MCAALGRCRQNPVATIYVFLQYEFYSLTPYVGQDNNPNLFGSALTVLAVGLKFHHLGGGGETCYSYFIIELGCDNT